MFVPCELWTNPNPTGSLGTAVLGVFGAWSDDRLVATLPRDPVHRFRTVVTNGKDFGREPLGYVMLFGVHW